MKDLYIILRKTSYKMSMIIGCPSFRYIDIIFCAISLIAEVIFHFFSPHSAYLYFSFLKGQSHQDVIMASIIREARVTSTVSCRFSPWLKRSVTGLLLSSVANIIARQWCQIWGCGLFQFNNIKKHTCWVLSRPFNAINYPLPKGCIQK